MFRFIRGLIKWSLIGGLGLVGLVALVGPARVKAAAESIREHVRSGMDDMVPTRQAVESEMTRLEKEYPQRIAELEMQLRQADRAITANTSDTEVCREVVALCRGDREALTARIGSADKDADGISPTLVEFRSERMPKDDAISKAARIAKTEADYSARLGDLTTEGEMLRGEREQIASELARTRQEYADFQMQYRSLLREADSLERKENLVDMADRRRGKVEDLFSDRASSLTALKDRMEKRRIELDSRLESYRNLGSGNEYEARARLRIQSRADDAR